MNSSQTYTTLDLSPSTIITFCTRGVFRKDKRVYNCTNPRRAVHCVAFSCFQEKHAESPLPVRILLSLRRCGTVQRFATATKFCRLHYDAYWHPRTIRLNFHSECVASPRILIHSDVSYRQKAVLGLVLLNSLFLLQPLQAVLQRLSITN